MKMRNLLIISLVASINSCITGNFSDNEMGQNCIENLHELISVNTKSISDTIIYFENRKTTAIIEQIEIYNCSDSNIHIQINEYGFLCVGKKVEYFNDGSPSMVSYKDYITDSLVEILPHKSQSILCPIGKNIERLEMTFQYNSDYYPDSTLFYTAKFEFD